MRYLLWLLLPLFAVLITIIVNHHFLLADKILHLFIGSNPFHEVLPTSSSQKPCCSRKAQVPSRKKCACYVKYIHIAKQQNPKFLSAAEADVQEQKDAPDSYSYVYIALFSAAGCTGCIAADGDLLLRIGRFPLLCGKAAAVGRPIAASDHDPVWRFLLPDRYLTKSRKWYLYTVPWGKKANIKNRMSARIAKIHLNSFLEET